MDPSVDLVGLYREFSYKLHKKIFRKPNVVAAKDDFAYLAKQLANEESFEYAAVFSLGKAKCEALGQNPVGEATALLDAARLFLRAEENLERTSAFSIGEFLEYFTSCCLRAAKIYESIEFLTFALNSYIYAGDTLMRFRKYDDAVITLSRAADIVCRDAPRSMHILFKCGKCQLATRDYLGALSTYERMQFLIKDACETHDYEVELFFDDLRETEMFRVLLTLITSGGDSLKSYINPGATKEDAFETRFMESEVFHLFKSLIMHYTSEDVNSFELTATLLQPYVTYDQRNILTDLLESIIHSII